LDVFETSAKILSAATNGASHTRVVTMNQHLRQDEIRWLLKMLVEKNLLELDSSATYWTTVEGAKFLEIQFHMDQMLQGQKSLV
jgi:predicted transcriptional regulator